MLYLFTLHATQYTLTLKYSKYRNNYSTLDTSYVFLHTICILPSFVFPKVFLYINIVYNNKCNIVDVNFVAIVKRKKAEVHGREEESEGIGQRNDTQKVGNGSMFYQAGHATSTIAGIFPRPAIIGHPLTLAKSAR